MATTEIITLTITADDGTVTTMAVPIGDFKFQDIEMFKILIALIIGCGLAGCQTTNNYEIYKNKRNY